MWREPLLVQYPWPHSSCGGWPIRLLYLAAWRHDEPIGVRLSIIGQPWIQVYTVWIQVDSIVACRKSPKCSPEFGKTFRWKYPQLEEKNPWKQTPSIVDRVRDVTWNFLVYSGVQTFDAYLTATQARNHGNHEGPPPQNFSTTYRIYENLPSRRGRVRGSGPLHLQPGRVQHRCQKPAQSA